MNNILTEIKAGDKPTILVFNKIDQFEPRDEWMNQDDDFGDEIPVAVRKQTALAYLKKTYLTQKADNVVFISAEKRENLDELRELLFRIVKEKHFTIYPNWVDVPLAELAQEVDETGDFGK